MGILLVTGTLSLLGMKSRVGTKILVWEQKKLITPLPALDHSGHHHFRPEPDTTTRSCQFLTTGSVYDQATRPPRPVSAISKPSPFFTKGFAVQAGMADLAIMEVAKLKIYIRNCYVVLRTIGRLNGGPSWVPLPGPCPLATHMAQH